MARKLVVALFAVAALAPARARAQAADDYGGAADAYCALADGVANSQSALAFSPQLFMDYGVVNGNDATTGAGGATALPPTHRLTIGARWSLVGLARGIILKQLAAADCERYRAESGLSRFLVENREQVSPAALDAKLAVLRAALPRAREIVRALRGAVEHAHATLEELQATQVRVDELEAAAAAAEAQRAGLPSRAALPPPSELLRRHQEADAEVARYEARLRIASAFDVSVRGGYDRFFGLRDVNPYFAVLSLTINPAAAYMPFAEASAQRARARVLVAENDGVEQKAQLLTARLQATLAGERRRLAELHMLVADVEGRLRTLDAIQGDKLRRFREATWFDWVRLKADEAQLRVHVADLSRALGQEGG